MLSYNIFMRYNPEKPREVSKPNKEMIEFLDKNIDQINKTGTEIIITLFDQDDTETLKRLERKGVKKLPAMLGRGIQNPIEKVDKIKKYIMSNSKSKKPIPNKDYDEELKDYQWDALAMGDDDAEGDTKRNGAEIRARVEFEQRRRKKGGQQSEKPLTADEIIARQRRGRSAQIRQKPKRDPSPEYASSESEDEKPKSSSRQSRHREKNNNDPDPADIMADMPARSRDEALDNDLSAKFWSGRGIGTD